MANKNPIINVKNIEPYNLKNRTPEERKRIASKGGKATAEKKRQQKKKIQKCKALLQITLTMYHIADMDYEGLYEELFQEKAPEIPDESTELKIYDKFEEITQGIK